MKVIVLGAGASVHAGYPLASQMGHSLEAWIETLPGDHRFRTIIRQIKERYSGLDDFESILESLMTRSQGPVRTEYDSQRPYILEGLQNALREQFAAIRSSPIGLYERLAGLLHPGDAVITFNYDLACEKALQDAGLWKLRTGYGFAIEDETPSSPVKLLKLHGSMNWQALLFNGRRHGGFAVHGNSLGYRPVLFIRDDLEYLGYDSFIDPLCTGLASAPVLPALILPALPKRFYFETSFGREWETFWAALWEQAEQSINDADEIVIIGYSLPIADEAARQLLLNSKNKAVPLTVCCGTSSATLRRVFERHGFTAIQHGPQNFAEFLDMEEASSGS